MSDSADIKRLTDVNRAPDAELVKALESLLEEAKSGSLRGVFVLKNYADCFGRLSSGQWAYRDAIYVFELWKKRLLEEADG